VCVCVCVSDTVAFYTMKSALEPTSGKCVCVDHTRFGNMTAPPGGAEGGAKRENSHFEANGVKDEYARTNTAPRR
jgi:hypothetical protein